MSLKRSHASGRSQFGGGADPGAKVGRQEIYDELKRLAGTGQTFAPVDVAMAIGAGEPQVAKALLGLAVEGYLEKAESNQYRSTPMVELTQPEFLKALSRASKVDSIRQRDLSEIGRLKQNNDVMRARLLQAIAERDHYLAALQRHGIDAGPPPAAPPPAAAPAESAAPPPSAAAPAPSAPEAAAPAPTTAGSDAPATEPSPESGGTSGG